MDGSATKQASDPKVVVPQPRLAKYLRLQQVLRERIDQLPVGAALPTMTSLRAEFKVSQGTIERAMQGLRVEGVLQGRRGSGIYVTSHLKQRCIGIVFGYRYLDPTTGEFPSLFYRALERMVRSRQMGLNYYISDYDADASDGEHGNRQLRTDVAAGRLDGLVIIGVRDAAGLDRLKRLGPPVVIMSTGQPSRSDVIMDGEELIRLGVRALKEQGCESLALLLAAEDQRPFHQVQIAAFFAALTQAGVRSNAAWLIPIDGLQPVVLRGYAEFRRAWQSWEEKPQGLVSFDDNATLGVLRAAEMLGIRVPQDLKIASHANKGSNLLRPFEVTRVEFDPEQVATAMLEQLEQFMAGKPVDRVVVEPSLVNPAAGEGGHL